MKDKMKHFYSQIYNKIWPRMMLKCEAEKLKLNRNKARKSPSKAKITRDQRKCKRWSEEVTFSRQVKLKTIT